MKELDFLAAFNQPWHVERDAGEPFPGSQRPAAVLICLNPTPQGLCVIFTQRAGHLKHHAGQISFPGGKAEDNDMGLVHTAYREAQEEIGLAPEQLKLIGRLPPYRTISGFAVTPIVAKHRSGVKVPNDLIIDANEVGEAFQVPLSFLMDKNNYFIHQINRGELQFPVYYITYQQHVIWGATAGMMALLRDHILYHS
ncbi:CoA pyrophosphatase [Glaciecola siphonariae]|uniref:CoA pyrophosphatase n=1 Tax=Glaciecola siphonariae TaxID=521012 RepID=A0ABV9LTM8_9ALTE